VVITLKRRIKMRLSYIVGDATDPQEKNGIRVICHINNDECVWGGGFVLAVSKKFGRDGDTSPEAQYRQWGRDGFFMDGKHKEPFKLGRIQLVCVENVKGRPNNQIFVCNMIAQSDCGGYMGFPPIRYQSLEECLMRLRGRIIPALDRGINVSIHSPRMGAFLAGGSWPAVEDIMNRVFIDIPLPWYVYDLPQKGAK
jgi:hypothetical protein